MRLSDFTGKEVINLGDGARLGFIEDCDLLFDGRTGRVNALLLPKRGILTALMGGERTHTVPWQTIRRIGDEVIIVDLNNAYERMFPVLGRDDDD
ncbi:MAG: YlmC/YmxH family sporulation protein [Sporomusaceae bacterium]|nr:YlmC/YmxH family sporulation protein [Sporomusaceae bacterium]